MKTSAGLLVYRIKNGKLEVLIAHMGAPWWARKDKGAWSIPKGLVDESEEHLAAAKREFAEEIGQPAPEGKYLKLGEIKQKNNKTVTAWAVEADIDVSKITSNTFKAEWPPRSGQTQEFPEIDRTGWLAPAEAMEKVVSGQDELIKRLAEKLNMPLAASQPTQEKLL
jgi:predicted NUDIX family NTP pyrophosphohydrolase